MAFGHRPRNDGMVGDGAFVVDDGGSQESGTMFDRNTDHCGGGGYSC